MNRLLCAIWKMLHLSRDAQLFIMRLFQDQFLLGVTGVIFNEKNEILLFKHTYRQTPWSLPGGFLKAKEHPIVGLEREIEEESGFIVSVEDRLRINIDTQTARLNISYSGSFIGGEFKSSSEVSDYGLFPLDQMPLISKDQFALIYKALQLRQQAQEALKSSFSENPKQEFIYDSRYHYYNAF